MKNKRILLICLPLLVSLAACKKNQEPGSSSLGASDTASSYDSSADSSTGSSSQGTSLTESSSSSEGNSSHYDSSSAGSSGNTDSSSGGSEVEVSVLRIESKTTTANKEYTDASFVSLLPTFPSGKRSNASAREETGSESALPNIPDRSGSISKPDTKSVR